MDYSFCLMAAETIEFGLVEDRLGPSSELHADIEQSYGDFKHQQMDFFICPWDLIPEKNDLVHRSPRSSVGLVR